MQNFQMTVCFRILSGQATVQSAKHKRGGMLNKSHVLDIIFGDTFVVICRAKMLKIS